VLHCWPSLCGCERRERLFDLHTQAYFCNQHFVLLFTNCNYNIYPLCHTAITFHWKKNPWINTNMSFWHRLDHHSWYFPPYKYKMDQNSAVISLLVPLIVKRKKQKTNDKCTHTTDMWGLSHLQWQVVDTLRYIRLTHFLPSKFLRTFSASKQQNNPQKLCKTNIQNMWQEVTS
jgi:hypothetical protein